jgi:hypothetical protein
MQRRVFLRLGGVAAGLTVLLAHHKPSHRGGPPAPTTTTLPPPAPASVGTWPAVWPETW